MNVIRAEASKFGSLLSIWILFGVTVIATWPMAITNATPLPEGISPDDPLLYSSAPVPVEYQGFEMAGFGYVLMVAAAALWAGSEFTAGRPLRTTFLAMPRRLSVFVVKASILALTTGATAVLTMTGTITITHAVGRTGVPWTLTPAIWGHILGVSFAWICTALIAFAIGCLTRSAIWPMVLVVPFAIGLGDFFATLWPGASFLPVTAGAALYSDPSVGIHLSPLAGAGVVAAWTIVLVVISGTAFSRRDVP